MLPLKPAVQHAVSRVREQNQPPPPHLQNHIRRWAEDYNRAFHRPKHHCWVAPSPTAHCSESMWALGLGLSPTCMAQLMAWLGMQLVLALCAVLSGAQEEPFGTISQRRKSPAFLQKASKTNELLCICSVVLTTGQGDLTPLQSSQLPQPPINLPL